MESLKVDYDIAENFEEINDKLNNNIYQVLISDYNLKYNKKSIDILKDISEENLQNTKKIMITSENSKEIEEKCYKAGYDICIQKPYTVELIIETLKKYFIGYMNIKDSSIKLNLENNKYKEILKKVIIEELPNYRKNIKNKEYNEVILINHKIRGAALIIKENSILMLLNKIEETCKRNEEKEGLLIVDEL